MLNLHQAGKRLGVEFSNFYNGLPCATDQAPSVPQ